MNQDDQEVKSKSQVKREMQALRDLGEELVELPPATLERLPLDPVVQQAITTARGFKREARRRQLQYIGKLLRDADADAIRHALLLLYQPHAEQVRAEHELEHWRDRLVAGDDHLLNALIDRFPDVDRQHLRQLIRNAQLERDRDKPPKAARQLFRYLRELRESG